MKNSIEVFENTFYNEISQLYKGGKADAAI